MYSFFLYLDKYMKICYNQEKQMFVSKTNGKDVYMEKTELKGKVFLERLLKFETDIGEKSAELAYWKKCAGLSDSLAPEIERRETELRTIISDMTEKKLVATRMIDELCDPVGRAILRRRYILCDTWSKIADACGGMSERNAHYIHDNALLDFEKIFCRTKCFA